MKPKAVKLKKIYSIRIHEWDPMILWEKCQDYEETLLIIKTNFDKIIGAYTPDKWEDTIDMLGGELVKNGKTFQYYFQDEEIKVCLQKDGSQTEMYSRNHVLLKFRGGIDIWSDRCQSDRAGIKHKIYDWPQDLGYARVVTDLEGQEILCIAGGDREQFVALELEIFAVI